MTAFAPGRQAGVVAANRLAANDDCVRPGAGFEHTCAGRRRRYPGAVAEGGRDLAVQRHRVLEYTQRLAGRSTVEQRL